MVFGHVLQDDPYQTTEMIPCSFQRLPNSCQTLWFNKKCVMAVSDQQLCRYKQVKWIFSLKKSWGPTFFSNIRLDTYIGVHLNFSSKLALKTRLWTPHGLPITDQLFKSNLTFCVVYVFTLQTDEWYVHNRTTPTRRINLWTPDMYLDRRSSIIMQEFAAFI
jgi:hypothetical protein